MSAVHNPVPFLDLSDEFEHISGEWTESIREIGKSGRFILGPNVASFESEFAAYIGTKHAISVANGTDALILSLRALGIGAEDEVITSPFTFFASAEAIDHVGATPVFADINEHTFTLEPDSIRQHLTDRTRAILVVHLFGCPVDMPEIMDIATQHGLEIIEDCAQSFGANSGSHKVGSIGSTGCFSFYPTKILGCYGDGGMISLNRQETVDRLLRLRNHGAVEPFIHTEIGYNSRLDEIQAALLRIKLRKVDQDIRRRREIAALYTELLHDHDVITPALPRQSGHVFNLYTIRLGQRDRARQVLTENGIACTVCYPQPLHLQPVYAHLGYGSGDLPVCERLASEVLSLPIFPAMTEKQVEQVVRILASAL
jgi:dTDP-4-amino-4,6-dideoxygalactose transaminase